MAWLIGSVCSHKISKAVFRLEKEGGWWQRDQKVTQLAANVSHQSISRKCKAWKRYLVPGVVPRESPSESSGFPVLDRVERKLKGSQEEPKFVEGFCTARQSRSDSRRDNPNSCLGAVKTGIKTYPFSDLGIWSTTATGAVACC